MHPSAQREFESHLKRAASVRGLREFASTLANAAFILGFAVCQGGTIVDRMAVVVGKHVIKASDIDRDLRVTAFLNNQPVQVNADSKRKAAERLIDQQIIHQEIVTSGMRVPSDDEGRMLDEQLQKDRFGGSKIRFAAALQHYGLDESQLRERLSWQMAVLRFIDQRFREGVLITDEDIRAYYDQHIAELRKQYPQNNSYETLEPKIRESLEGERVDQNFNQWLEAARRRAKIEYKQEAFQ